MVLLNWYSYSITYLWNFLGKVFIKSFHLLEKLNWIPDWFYIILICFLLALWMVIMRNYYKDHRDKGIIQ